MIFPLIFLSISVFFGYQLIKRIAFRLSLEETLISGIILGVVINGFLNYLLAYIFGISLIIIIISQTFLFVVSLFLFIWQQGFSPESNSKTRNYLIVTCFLALLLFIPLFVSHMLYSKNGNLYSGITEWGDLAIHTTLINNFLYQDQFPLPNPILSGTKLIYPPLVDFISALFVIGGSSFQQSLYLPGIFFAVSIIAGIFLLAYQITKNLLGASLAPFLFIFNGGVGFLYFLKDYQDQFLNFWYILTHLDKDYARFAAYGLEFGNVVVVSFIPQRTFLIGYAIGILSIFFILKYFENKHKSNLIISAILSGILVLAHTHSLIGFSIILATLILINFNFRVIRDFSKYFLPPFLLIAFVWIWPILISVSQSSNFVRFQFFWLAKDVNIFWFYFKNFGLYLPLLILSFIFLPKKIVKNFIPFAVIFVITNIIIFQPWDYDNVKIMFYFVLGMAILIGYLFAKLWTSKFYFTKIATLILIFFTVASGILSVLYESFSIHQIYDQKGIEVAQEIRNLTKPNDIILTSDQHNHPVTSFSGRFVVMGYRGWLWTWGYDYRERERDVLDIYQGSSNTKELINKYNISLIVVGPSEKSQFLANESFFDQNFHLLLRTDNYKVYDAKNI